MNSADVCAERMARDIGMPYHIETLKHMLAAAFSHGRADGLKEASEIFRAGTIADLARTGPHLSDSETHDQPEHAYPDLSPAEWRS